MPPVRMDVINLYQCDPGFATPVRFLCCDYLLYVHSGRGRFQIGSTVYPAAVGDLFFCPPGVGNAIFADAEDPFLLSGIECNASAFREKLPARVSLLSHRFLIELIGEMVREYRLGKNGSREICSALLQALLRNFCRMADSPAPGRDFSEELLSYIQENIASPLTHAQLSRVFNCHKNTINRILLRQTGMPLKPYLIEQRIRRAAGLLRYSDRPVSEIAEFCGYSSAVFFCRQFREKTGLSPAAYRRAAATPAPLPPEPDAPPQP